MLVGVLEFFSVFSGVFCCYRLLNLLFINEYREEKRERLWQNLLMLAFSFLLSLVLLLKGAGLIPGSVNLPMVLIAVSLTSIWVFRAQKPAVISVILFYYMLKSVFEILAVILFSVVLQRENAFSLGDFGYGRVKEIYLLLTTLLWIFFYLVFARLRKGKAKNGIETYTVWIFTASLLGFAAVYYFKTTAFLSITHSLIRSWTFLMLLFFMGAILGLVYKKYRDAQEKNHLMEVQNLFLEQNYRDMQEIYASASGNFHDMKNHWNTVYRLVQEDQKEEALRYMEQVKAPFRQMEEKIWTKNRILDLILNAKYSEFQEEGIFTEVDTEILPPLPIEDFDLCTIFANLLDNAKEACGQIAEREKRWISINIKKKNQMLFISIANSLKNPPVEKNGRLLTTKPRKKLHGLGLENVRRALEHCDGYLSYSYDSEKFEVVVSVPI